MHTKKAEVILQVKEPNIDFAPRKNGGKETERQNGEEKMKGDMFCEEKVY